MERDALIARDPEFDILPWDSERFGFPVARVHSSVPPHALAGPAERMRAAGVVLAYYSVDATVPEMAPDDARRLGATLIDTRVDFALPVAAEPERGAAIRAPQAFVVESLPPGAISPELAALGREAGRYSRFRVDPRIEPAVFRAIYDAWLSRSVAREIADEVFVAEPASGGAEVGLVTLAAHNRIATIGLLAVDQSVRGQGLGSTLFRAAVQWAAARKCAELRVATQTANQAACAMYTSLGCALRARTKTYHLWLG